MWKAGLTRSIGVSNFNSTHMQELANAGLPLPSVYFFKHCIEVIRVQLGETVLLGPTLACRQPGVLVPGNLESNCWYALPKHDKHTPNVCPTCTQHTPNTRAQHMPNTCSTPDACLVGGDSPKTNTETKGELLAWCKKRGILVNG